MNRTRTTQALGPIGTMTHTSNYSPIGGPWSHRLTQVDSTMSDVVTKDFKKRIASGEVINNPCSNSKTSIFRETGGTYNATRISNPALYSRVSGSGCLTAAYRQALSGPAMLTVNLPVNDLAQAAQASALASIDKAPYAIAEDIATIREAYRFAVRPWASIEELALHYARARKSLRFVAKHGSTLRRTPQSLASLWLEYRFAFMPMVRSVVNVFASLADATGRKYDTIHTAHGTSELEKSSSDSTVLSNFTFNRGVKKKQTVRAVVQYRVQPPLREWQYKYGLRFKDVPELMWDLFPLSFMYDRIWNIGDAVRGLTNFSDPSVNILGGTVSVTTETQQDISMVKQTASGWTVIISPDTEYLITESYVRSIWQPSVLNVVPPVLPGGLVKDLTSMADLGALILQRLK
jgi:hypothetical protein